MASLLEFLRREWCRVVGHRWQVWVDKDITVHCWRCNHTYDPVEDHA